VRSKFLLLRSVNLNHEKGEVSYPPTLVQLLNITLVAKKNQFLSQDECIVYWAILKLSKSLGFRVWASCMQLNPSKQLTFRNFFGKIFISLKKQSLIVWNFNFQQILINTNKYFSLFFSRTFSLILCWTWVIGLPYVCGFYSL